MTQSLFTLGRQPALGMAELESLLGADTIAWAGPQAAIVASEGDLNIPYSRLGGSTRQCRLLTTLEYTDWAKIEEYLSQSIPEHLQYVPEGKLKLGLSHIGGGIGAKQINATGLRLKKIIKAAGRSVRLVPNTAPELNAGQIIHNQLTGPTGWELVLVRDGKHTHVTQTIHVQDITAYTARDQKRPKRDARVGMLPPKLAQIIVNLASNQGSVSLMSTLHDPFCGTGVLLQEALLMEYDVYGSDIEPRMIEYSEVNLQWLDQKYGVQHGGTLDLHWNLSVADATSADFISHHVPPQIERIACETYLGRPLTTLPAPDKLAEIINDCDTIHRKFLQNVARQTRPGVRLCLAVPAWKTKTGFKHLKTLESLRDLGYNRLRFVHARNEDLIYHRPEQTVARELVILERI